MENLLTCEQVAERYSVSVTTIWDWIKDRRLTAIKISSRLYRIRARDLEAFEKQHETTRGA